MLNISYLQENYEGIYEKLIKLCHYDIEVLKKWNKNETRIELTGGYRVLDKLKLILREST